MLDGSQGRATPVLNPAYGGPSGLKPCTRSPRAQGRIPVLSVTSTVAYHSRLATCFALRQGAGHVATDASGRWAWNLISCGEDAIEGQMRRLEDRSCPAGDPKRSDNQRSQRGMLRVPGVKYMFSACWLLRLQRRGPWRSGRANLIQIGTDMPLPPASLRALFVRHVHDSEGSMVNSNTALCSRQGNIAIGTSPLEEGGIVSLH